jgi:plastocyanin
VSKNMLTRLAPIFAGFLVAGCLPAAQGGPEMPDLAEPVHVDTPPVGEPNPPPPPDDLAGSVVIDAFTTSGTAMLQLSETTTSLRLNEHKDVTVTISNATGSGTLALVGAPAGVTATFNPATVTLTGAPVPVTMTIHAASDMAPATSVATMVQVTVGGAASTTTYGITVMPELVLYISAGVITTATNTTAFGAAAVPVKLLGTGTKVTFINNDSIEHRIHADGTGGLDHQANNMAANGGTYTDTLTATGPINFVCHIHTKMKGHIDVQ